MKKIKMRIAVFASLILIASTATAQKGTLKLNLNYNYSMPVSGFKSDLIKDNSPRGVVGGLMYSFTNKLEAGIETGYQDFYQKYPRSTYALDKTQTISAVLSNSIQTTPFLLKAKYSLLNGMFVRPYVTLGAGANVIDFKQYFGEFGSGQTNVGFLGQGGAGVNFPFGRTGSSGINIGATYNYSPYKKYGYNDLNTFNLQAGLIFKLQ